MKVASKIRILASGLAVLSSVVVGLVMYGGYRDTITSLEGDILGQRVDADVSRLNEAFKEVSHDIRFLEGLPDINALLNGAKGSEAEFREDLSSIFRQLLLAKPYYVQVRLIGAADGGREWVRLDRSEEGVVVCPDSELQRKGQRDYFLQTKATRRGEIYYSDVNLNRENGRIETPSRPMLRVAMPVYDSMDRFGGMVIINLDFSGFANEFVGDPDFRFAHYLCNAEGDYLLHPDPNRTYGFDLGTRYLVQDEYPELGDFLNSDEKGVTLQFDRKGQNVDMFFHLRRFKPLESERVFYYGIAASFDEVISASHSILLRTVLIMIVLLVLALGGAFGVSLLITKPIERITSAARSFEKGREEVELPFERSDEIGTLAHSFKEMRASIKEQEERILQANRKLSTANLDLNHFAHISSHELREPLTRIAGLSSILELEFSELDKGDFEKLVRSLKEEALGALRQITDFRYFAKLGDGVSVRESTDLNVLVREVLERFSSDIESRGVIVSVDKMPTVDVYESLVRVLFRNLVENALNYGRGDGIRLSITCEQREGAWVYGVLNTGSSIDAKDADRIFQVFTRLEQGTDGTGLGLSICKCVVERHKGEIWVESGNDVTNFKFTLEKRDR